MIRAHEAGIYGGAALVSFVLHFGVIGGLSSAAQNAPHERARVLEFAVVEPPPPPEPEPEPEPEKPEPPEPEPVDLTEVEIPEEAIAPPPNTDDGEEEPEESKPVFGVSMSSVVGPGTGGGFRVRVGNTLMKDPDEEFVPPEEVKKYQPVPLYKVSKRPRYAGGPCKVEYPAEAKRLGIEGRVELEVEVRSDGTVGVVKVVKGLGYGLDEAAIRAIKACPFTPGEIAGKSVTTIINIPYLFILED